MSLYLLIVRSFHLYLVLDVSVCAISLVLNIKRIVTILSECSMIMTSREYSIGGDEFGSKNDSWARRMWWMLSCSKSYDIPHLLKTNVFYPIHYVFYLYLCCYFT